MQREITVNEVESTIKKYTNIVEPLLIKRDNEEDLIIISAEEYKKKIFLAELDKKLEEGEEDIRNNKVHNARKVFKELREEYGY